MIRVQNSWEMSSRTRQVLQAFLTMPIDSQSPWQNGKTERAGQSFKHQLWDLDEECHIEGRWSLKLQWPSVVKQGTDTAIDQVSRRTNACLVPACVYLEAC